MRARIGTVVRLLINIDHENGTKMSWTEALGSLDLATAIPTCGSEEAVAQELQQDDLCHIRCWSSLLLWTIVFRFLSLCCVRPGSEIAHELERYTGAALALAKEASCLMFPQFELQLADQHSGDLAGRRGGTGGASTGGEPVTVLGAGFKNAGAALIRGGGFGLRVEGLGSIHG